MKDLFIDINEVKDHSKRIESYNHTYLAELEAFSEVMYGLVEHWDSPSANSLYREFQRFAPIFDKYYEHIDSYREFLDHSTQTYEMLDKAIENGIDVN